MIKKKANVGPLEKAILEVLWKKKHAKVREIYDILKNNNKIAHTSVAVLLDRLHEQKLVTREVESCRGGYRYIYCPVSKKEDFQKQMLSKAVDSLIERFGNTAVSYFDERFGKK